MSHQPRAVQVRQFEERWEDVPEERRLAIAAKVAWECWDELSDEDKAIIDPPDAPRP